MKLTEEERGALKALGETDESLDRQELAFTAAAEREPVPTDGMTEAEKKRLNDKFVLSGA